MLFITCRPIFFFLFQLSSFAIIISITWSRKQQMLVLRNNISILSLHTLLLFCRTFNKTVVFFRCSFYTAVRICRLQPSYTQPTTEVNCRLSSKEKPSAQEGGNIFAEHDSWQVVWICSRLEDNMIVICSFLWCWWDKAYPTDDIIVEE